jgi:hypothetical protein
MTEPMWYSTGSGLLVPVGAVPLVDQIVADVAAQMAVPRVQDEPDEQRRWAEAHEDMLSHLNLLWYGRAPEGLDFCGCGNPEDVWRLIHSILALTPLHEDGHRQQVRELVGTDAAFHVVLYVMTSGDLLEHGGSVGGSWITPKGEWARWAIGLVADEWGWDTVDEMVSEFGLPHYHDVPQDEAGVCGPDCWTVPA